MCVLVKLILPSSFWNLCVPRMFTKLKMIDHSKQIGLNKKETCVRKHSLKETWIHFSCRIKNYMPNICQNFQKVEVATWHFQMKLRVGLN